MPHDKTYVQTDNGLLFNVTGYDHPPNFVFANLKYVDGQKWTKGYDAARKFLKRKHPDFVDVYIRVPLDRIVKKFTPQSRWAEIRTAGELSELHQQALILGKQLSGILQIPISEFGITDSLLWGDGHVDSDIDLIVTGLKNADHVLRLAHTVYEYPGFTRPDPTRMKAPYGLDVTNWPEILSRKYHMGCYRNRLFSLRVVLTDDEVRRQRMVAQVGFADWKNEVITFAITDTSRSLLFPTMYRNDVGDELVDYSVVYEGVFRAGEVVRCRAIREKLEGTGEVRNRYTIVGACELVG